MPGFNSTWTMNFHMFKLDWEKAEETDQVASIHCIIEKVREFQKYIYFFFNDYTKAFDCVNHNKLWKILKEMRIPGHLTWLLRNIYAGQEATVRTGSRKKTVSKSGKEYVKAAYLTYMQSTLYEMPSWRKNKLESRLPGEITITSDMQMTPPWWQKAKN